MPAVPTDDTLWYEIKKRNLWRLSESELKDGYVLAQDKLTKDCIKQVLDVRFGF